MNRVGDIDVRGRVLFSDWRRLTDPKHPASWMYNACVSLVRYEVNHDVEALADTGWVPEPYLLGLYLRADVGIDREPIEPVVESVLGLDGWPDDPKAIRLAISRFDEMISHADEAIAEWRMDQGLDKPETT